MTSRATIGIDGTVLGASWCDPEDDALAKAVPLIRAAALAPILTWATEQHLPVERHLSAVGLGGFPWDDLERPIPFLSCLRLLRLLVEGDGVADLGCRAVTLTSVAELGRFGQLVLAGRTPREAFGRVAVAMPRFCSHQRVVVIDRPNGCIIRFAFPKEFDPVAVHVSHQYAATMVRGLLAAVAPADATVKRIAISAGSSDDVTALRSWLVDDIVVGEPNVLAIELEGPALDRRLLPLVEAARVEPLPALGHDAGLAVVCLEVVDLMVDEGGPTVAQLAAATGLSVRTLQRQLGAEGTSFTGLLDSVRRRRAMRALDASGLPIGQVAEDVGYAAQSSLSRAVRRWIGTTPRAVRSPHRTAQDRLRKGSSAAG